MTKSLLPIAAILATLTLAACGDAPSNDAAQPSQPAVNVETQPDGSSTVQINVPESMTPAVEAISNPQQTMDNLRDQAATMSEQAKQDAVVSARRAAEAAARALGQTEAEITEAGDVAERSTRDALGLR
ncbi:MAG: hypothetical protein ABS75_22900 [Pelagibacterium sp. SCN 63-23]|jgi:hypothetical protein|nr:MAG: hypothetical protein ABS75_22900 [Pelagibacterium sp. SCN 63-23]